MEKQLTLKVTFDSEKVRPVDLTDAFNETLHSIAVESDLHSDPQTGGYREMDWKYQEDN